MTVKRSFLLKPEMPAKYARKLVYTTEIFDVDDDIDRMAVLASIKPWTKFIRRKWADGTIDWYARVDGSEPTEDELIEPYFAACLQIGYFNEVIALFRPAATERVLRAVLCLEGRVAEDQRIELVNYVRAAKDRDKSDIFALCYRVSRRGAAMLKDNRSYYNWFVLGQELGRCKVRQSLGNWFDPEWRNQLWEKARLEEAKLKTQSFDQFVSSAGLDAEPTEFPEYFCPFEIQPLLDVLADGWQLFPLPTAQRIESSLTIRLPKDASDMFESEKISCLEAKRIMAGANSTAKSETMPPVPSGSEDPNSSADVLKAVIEMIKGPNPNFTRIGELVEPRLRDWSDDEVRGLLKLDRLSDTAKMFRSAMEEGDARNQLPRVLRIQYNCVGSNQRNRLVLRLLERLGEYNGFGKSKAARRLRSV